jgi:ATP-dependent DNA helicase RecQ
MTYGLADVVQQRRLIELSEADEAHKRISTAKLDALLGLCETAGCRRVRLLAYFGESSQPCGNCDTCLDPPATFDASDAARKALSAIYRTGQRFGAVYVIDVLRGKASERMRRFGHDRLGVFGIGADEDETHWRNVMRQLVALGLAEVDHAAHGALRLGPRSRPVLRGEETVRMRRVVQGARRAGARRASVTADLTHPDTALFERLKEWRRGEARAQGVPAYVILHDRTLAEIAQRRPATLQGLEQVSGIGARKLERYGQALIGVVGDAVPDH